MMCLRFMGGNSTKATSGINGAGTQTQQEAGIPDNAKIFFEDTKKSVRSLPRRLAWNDISFRYSRLVTWLGTTLFVSSPVDQVMR